MSSAPSGGQEGPAREPGRPGGPPPERKAVAGPVITPQVLAIAFGIILVIGLIAYYQMVVDKYNDQLAEIESGIQSTERQIRTYETKMAKLEQARGVNLALREKLNLINYLFLQNQDSIVPFFEDTVLPLIEKSRMTLIPDTSFIEVDQYEFQINMAMEPFETLPGSLLFEDPVGSFGITYLGEKGGTPDTSPLDTRPGAFLEPYNMRFIAFGGTYEDVKDFIEDLQTAEDDILITVHCLMNDEGENFGIYRTFTQWDIALTVYFMNPEASAAGDTPPDPPGAQTC